MSERYEALDCIKNSMTNKIALFWSLDIPAHLLNMSYKPDAGLFLKIPFLVSIEIKQVLVAPVYQLLDGIMIS